jgi:hypothetical protein
MGASNLAIKGSIPTDTHFFIHHLIIACANLKYFHCDNITDPYTSWQDYSWYSFVLH